SGQEDVDPRITCSLDRFPCAIDIDVDGARERCDLWALHRFGDLLDRFEVTDGRDREPGLDDVDLESRQLLGDLELLFRVQRDAGSLLAITTGGVEDENLVQEILL